MDTLSHNTNKKALLSYEGQTARHDWHIVMQDDVSLSHSQRCYRSLSLSLYVRLLSRSFPYCVLTLSLCLWSPSAPARDCPVGAALVLHAPCRQPSDIACCGKAAPCAHSGWMYVLMMMTIYVLVNKLLCILCALLCPQTLHQSLELPPLIP